MKSRLLLPSLATFALAVFGAGPLPADSGSLKVLKFEADWCGACQKMKPVFSSVAGSSDGVSFQSIDIDRQASLADRYGVKQIPTIVAVKNGREVGRLTGYQNAAKLQSFVKKHR